MNKFECKMKLLIPYRRYEGLRSVFKVTRPLNEIEAIILSFIHVSSNDSKQKSKNFHEEFFKTFNLDKNKWNDFFQKIFEKMNGNEIEKIDLDDDNLLCGEIKIIDAISNNIENHKFLGIEQKERVDNLNLNFPIFESIVSKEKQVLNNNLLDYKNVEIEGVKNILKNYSRETWKDDEDSIDTESEKIKKSNELFIRKEGYELDNIEIIFDMEEHYLTFWYEGQKIILSSNDKLTLDILKKYVNENIMELISFSIINNLENLNEFDNSDKEIIELIDINNYFKIKEKINQFNKDNFIEGVGNIFIDDEGNLLNINKKEFSLCFDDIDLDSQINLMVSIKSELTLYQLIEKNLKNKNLKNLNLLDKLNENEKVKVCELIKENIIDWINIDFIKKYTIDNMIDILDNNLLLNFMNINSISINEWKNILKNDSNEKIKKAIEENINKNIFSNDNELALKKLLTTIETSDLNIYNQRIFKLDFFEDINNL